MKKEYLYFGGGVIAAFLVFKWWQSKQPFVPSSGATYTGPGNVAGLTGTGSEAE